MLFQSMGHHCNNRLNLRDIDNLYVIVPEVFAGYKCTMRSSEQVDIGFGISRENRQGKDITLPLATKIIQDFGKTCDTILCNKLDKKIGALVLQRDFFCLIHLYLYITSNSELS